MRKVPNLPRTVHTGTYLSAGATLAVCRLTRLQTAFYLLLVVSMVHRSLWRVPYDDF